MFVVLPVPVSISTVKSPDASESDGLNPLRSRASLRLASISSSSSVSRLPMPRSFSIPANAAWTRPKSRVTVNSVRQIS